MMMNKSLYALLGLCLLAGPVFGQVPVLELPVVAAKKAAQAAPKKVVVVDAAKQIAKQTTKKAARKQTAYIGSKRLLAQVQLANQNQAAAQLVAQQRTMQIVLQEELTFAQKIALIEKYRKEDARVLKELTEIHNKELFAYGKELYRERSHHFLPAKEKNIPGLFAVSADPARYANISPRYFTEFINLIPQYDNVPGEVNGLIIYLSRNLLKLDKKMLDASQRIIETERYISAATNMAEKGRLIGTRNRLNGELSRYSKEAAQNMTDLVHILNSYPHAYESSLTLLAVNLEKTFPTPFTKFLRAKIKVDLPKDATPRRKVGFN